MFNKIYTKRETPDMFIEKSIWEEFVELQKKLNVQYSGENWSKDIPYGKFEDAFLVEYAEFLDEIKPHWKFWKKESNMISKSLVVAELVDVIHFGLSMILHKWGVVRFEKMLKQETRHDAQKVFLMSPHISFLDDLVQTTCEEVGLTKDDVINAYYAKNKINNTRATSGYQTGEYRGKKDEDRLIREAIEQRKKDAEDDVEIPSVEIEHRFMGGVPGGFKKVISEVREKQYSSSGDYSSSCSSSSSSSCNSSSDSSSSGD